MRRVPSARARWLGRLARGGLALLGLGAIAALVEDAGAGAVLRAVAGAGAWLPLILLAELALVLADVVSLRVLFATSAVRVPIGAWLRGAMMAYAAGVFLPAGRVAGEVARATQLAPHVGAARAVAGATLLQGSFLWGTALASIACWVAVAAASSPTSLLSLLALGNAAWTGALGTLLLLGPRTGRLGARLALRATSGPASAGLALHGEAFDRAVRAMPALPLVPIAAALLARGAQVAQCAVLLVAVGGACDTESALVAEAIHLVASNVGDAVPGQAGVTEGAYRMFAPSLGLASAVAQAVALALLLRVCRLGLAAASAAACALWTPAAAPRRGAPSAAPSEETTTTVVVSCGAARGA